jgi:hypothetical protein
MASTRSVSYWIFKIQAILLLLFWGVNLVIPLAVTPLVSVVWIAFGIGLWIVADGVRDSKRWAPFTTLFVTTLPYLVFPVIMNLLQRSFFIYEGPKDVGVFDILLMYWFFFLLNLVLSIILVSNRGDFQGDEAKKPTRAEKWVTTPIIIAIALLVISIISAATWIFWKSASVNLVIVPFTIAFLGSLTAFIIGLTTFLRLRREGGADGKLYKVSKTIIIVALILLVIITPIEIMSIRYVIVPPEYGIALAIGSRTQLSEDDSPMDEWKKYVSEVSQFSIEYPPSWFVDQESLRLTKNRVVVFKHSGGTALFSIELSRKKSSEYPELGSNSVAEISFAGETAYLYTLSFSDENNGLVEPSKIYIPHGEKTYVIQLVRYDLEQVKEALDTFQIL